jgi:hypothetical protein
VTVAGWDHNGSGPTYNKEEKMIYIYDQEIEITEARMIPVWIAYSPGKIVWHYKQVKPRGKTRVHCEPVWHIKGRWKSGGMLNGGGWRSLSGITADNGIHEILAECHRLAPDQEEKFQRWNKVGGPEATEIFPPVTQSEIRW